MTNLTCVMAKPTLSMTITQLFCHQIFPAVKMFHFYLLLEWNPDITNPIQRRLL